MSLALVVAAVVVACFLAVRARAKKSRRDEPSRDTTPALDAWIADALERELAETVLGVARSTPEERRSLARSLRGDADPDVVARIEDKVRAVELEFVRYAHETDAEITLRVRYEDGATGTASRRLTAAELPEAVRADFERRGGTRVFRTWVFPWSRVVAL